MTTKDTQGITNNRSLLQRSVNVLTTKKDFFQDSKDFFLLLLHDCLVFRTALAALIFSHIKAIQVAISSLNVAQSLSDPEPDASSSDVGGVLSIGSSTSSSSSSSFLTLTGDDFFFLSVGSSSELTFSFLTLISGSVSFFTSSSFCKKNKKSLSTHAPSHYWLILHQIGKKSIQY